MGGFIKPRGTVPAGKNGWDKSPPPLHPLMAAMTEKENNLLCSDQ